MKDHGTSPAPREGTPNKTLAELYTEHQGKVSDKWSLYIREYDRILTPYRHDPVNLLEIGVQNGGSLEIWARFLRAAQNLIGCDVNPDCARLRYDDPRIRIVVGDANTDAVEKTIAQHTRHLNVVIDDGSHRSSDIVKSFARYFPRLVDGGVFIIEDLHCSYWSDFEGGLSYSLSSIAFIKRLADVINHEHWELSKPRTSHLDVFFKRYGCSILEDQLARIHSIELLNSMCVIRKAEADSNTLGSRFIAGKEELVVRGHRALHGSQNRPPNRHKSPWRAIRRIFGR
jgi:Methyltransferase domain